MLAHYGGNTFAASILTDNISAITDMCPQRRLILFNVVSTNNIIIFILGNVTRRTLIGALRAFRSNATEKHGITAASDAVVRLRLARGYRQFDNGVKAEAKAKAESKARRKARKSTKTVARGAEKEATEAESAARLERLNLGDAPARAVLVQKMKTTMAQSAAFWRLKPANVRGQRCGMAHWQAAPAYVHRV